MRKKAGSPIPVPVYRIDYFTVKWPWSLSLGTAVLIVYRNTFSVCKPICVGPCLSLCPGGDPKNSQQGFRKFSTCLLGSVLSNKIKLLCCSMYTRKGVSHLLDRVEFSINLSLGLKQTVLAVLLTKGKKSCYKCGCYLFKHLETFRV